MPLLRKSGVRAPWMPAPLLCRRHEPTAMRAGRVWLAAHARQRGGVAAHSARHTSPPNTDPLRPLHDRDWPAADARQRCGLGPAARAAAQHRPAQAAARACRRATCADGPGRVAARAESAERRPAAAAGGVGAQTAPVASSAAVHGARDANFGAVAAVPQPYLSRPCRRCRYDPAVGRRFNVPADTESEQR